MNFLLLCIQSTVCVACVYAVKRVGIISFRDFDMKDAKTWFPISFLLVSVIYTGSKSLVRGFYEGCLLLDLTTSSHLAAIPFYPRLHDLQELDHHSHCESIADPAFHFS